MEVLKQENRHLVNQISQGKGKNAVPKTGSTTEDHDSWDSDSISHDHNQQGGATTTMVKSSSISFPVSGILNILQ